MIQKDDLRKTLIKKSFGPQGRFPSLPWDFYIITQWSCIAHQDHCRRWIRTRDLKRLSILIQKTEVYHLYVSISKITVEFIQRPEDLKKTRNLCHPWLAISRLDLAIEADIFTDQFLAYSPYGGNCIWKILKRSPTNDVCDILNFVLILTI